MRHLHIESKEPNLLHSLGVLMATASQYTNLPAIHQGKTQQLQTIKSVKGDEDYDVLSYTKEYLELIEPHVDVEQSLDEVFEGFLTEASLVPCQKSEIKTFFHLMYEALKQPFQA